MDVQSLAAWVPSEAVERGIHQAISWSLIVSGLSLVVVSFFVRAPYGRYVSPGWGPRMSARVGTPSSALLRSCPNPHAGWVIQESPAFIVFALVFFFTGKSALISNPVNRTFAAMFLWHYFYRSFIYSLKLRGNAPPVLTVFLGWLFCLVNGYLQGMHSGVDRGC